MVVDVGDSLAMGSGAIKLNPELLRIGSVIMRAQGIMGLDVMAPGEAELSMGRKWLAAQARANGMQWLSANIKGPGGRRLGPASVILERGKVKVGLLGVTELSTASKEVKENLRKSGWRGSDVATAAKKQVKILRKKGAELVVMLGHVGIVRARELAREVPGIHLIVVGHSGAKLMTPEKVGSTYLVEAGRRGREVGHVEFRLGDSWNAASALADDSHRQLLFQQARKAVDDLAARLNTAQANAAAEAELKSLQQQAEVAAKAYEGIQAPRGEHLMIASLIKLNSRIKDHPAINTRPDPDNEPPPPAQRPPARVQRMEPPLSVRVVDNPPVAK